MNMPQTSTEWTNLAIVARAGDADARAALAEALGILARKVFCCARLSVEDAEDLAQEAVWHIFQRLDKFQGKRFPGWVHAVFRNRLRDHFRRQSRRPRMVPPLENDQELFEAALLNGPGSNGILDEEGHAAVEAALRQLTMDDRHLVESQAGFRRTSFRQMAKELGISETCARVRHHRARQKLQLLLQNDRRMEKWLARYHAY
jgi:RNA polymerase sigma factor (sigma-70 family)